MRTERFLYRPKSTESSQQSYWTHDARNILTVFQATFRWTTKCTSFGYRYHISLWRRANARNVRLYYPYWQYTNLFIFPFVSLLCLGSTLRLLHLKLGFHWGIFSSDREVLIVLKWLVPSESSQDKRNFPVHSYSRKIFLSGNSTGSRQACMYVYLSYLFTTVVNCEVSIKIEI